MLHTAVLSPAVLALLLPACLGDGTVEFPPGLAPLEENTAPWPQPEGDDTYPETPSVVSGEGEDWAWVHLRGYVHGTVDETWAALQDPEVVLDRREVDEWSVTQLQEEGYDVSFSVHNIVHDVITIEFDVAWREGAVEGTLDDPQVVGVRFQKVEGTDFIELMEGSVTVYEVTEDATAIEIIEHLDATGTDPVEACTSWMSDLYASVVARVAGDPLPTWI